LKNKFLTLNIKGVGTYSYRGLDPFLEIKWNKQAESWDSSYRILAMFCDDV